MLRLREFAGAGIAAGLTACGPSPAPAPPQTPTVASLTLEQLRNAEYRSQWPAHGLARLADGLYREPAAPGSATEILVRATDWHAFGDLDADGTPDAVIVLEGDPGGSGVFFDLVPVLNRGGRPMPLSPTLLGDRVQIEFVEIAGDGGVVVQMIKHGPDDPQCCPTLDVIQRYRLEGEQLVEVSQDPNRLSASPLTRKVLQSLTPTAPIFW
jgi:hypothetical protein